MRRLLNWGTFVLVLGAVWFLAGPTALGGDTSYVIVDGTSMEPTYQDGDLVIAKARASYAPGDVVVYDAPIDQQFNVIHRIVEPVNDGYVTRGDNMPKPDGWIAPREEVYGAAWFHIPNGGILVRLLRQPAVIAGLLAGLATFEFLKHTERRARENAPTDDAAEVLA